jgi:hypothetical protein
MICGLPDQVEQTAGVDQSEEMLRYFNPDS